jgi:hypothetical protein
MGPLSYMRSVVDRNVVMWRILVFSDSFVAFQMPALYNVHVKSAVMWNGKLKCFIEAIKYPTKAAICYAMLYHCDAICYVLQ